MRPADAIALLSALLADDSPTGLPSVLRQTVSKLLTPSNLHGRGLDVTTHWTSPDQSLPALGPHVPEQPKLYGCR